MQHEVNRAMEQRRDVESGKYSFVSTSAEANPRDGVKDVTVTDPAERDGSRAVIFRAGRSCRHELAALAITRNRGEP